MPAPAHVWSRNCRISKLPTAARIALAAKPHPWFDVAAPGGQKLGIAAGIFPNASGQHNITCPTLVVGGRHDWICAPEFSEEIASLIPHADLRIFERSGHEVIYDEPNELFDVIRGFLTYNS
jgi:pimeloyl-ACP methyl ester carboxylesterase